MSRVFWTLPAFAAALTIGPLVEPVYADGVRRRTANRTAAIPPRSLAAMWAMRLDQRFDDPSFGDNEVPAPDMEPISETIDLGNRPIADDKVIRLRAAIDVNPNSSARTCAIIVPSERPDLDTRACKIFSSRSGYRVRYRAPLQPIENRLIYGVTWAKPERLHGGGSGLSAGGLPIDRSWPRRSWASHVTFLGTPDISKAYPQAAFRDRTEKTALVGLDVFFSAATGFSNCEIGLPSGSREIDSAACDVVRTLKLEYPNPCTICGDWLPIPIKILWRPSGSIVRLPVGGPAPRIDDRNAVWPLQGSFAGGSRPSFQWKSGSPNRKRLPKALRRLGGGMQIPLKIDFSETGAITGCPPNKANTRTLSISELCSFVQNAGLIIGFSDVFGDPVAGSTTVSINLP
jgi:hypothetical protein